MRGLILMWGRGGLTASPPVGALHAPASVSPHYAGKIRVMPGKDALHAKDFQRLPRVSTSRARMCSSVVCPSQCAI